MTRLSSHLLYHIDCLLQMRKVRVIFDREQQDSYQLTLTACDKGTPKR